MTDEIVVPITPDRVPFLIGIKGRNVALIGKHTGAFLKVGDTSVQIVPRKSGAFNGDLAQRLVLGVCQGAILKWFSKPAATSTQYPEACRLAMDANARAQFGCGLQLMRARTGHMALVLVPLTLDDVQRILPARAAVLQWLQDQNRAL